jgi:Protein of unknown function (DUF3276)
VAYEQQDNRQESVFSIRIKAGKKRTYFFDIKETRSNDFYLTITESLKRFDDNGYDRHKIFIYKEDLNKFQKAVIESIDFVKTELMPNFDFDAFNHEYPENIENNNIAPLVEAQTIVEESLPILPISEPLIVDTSNIEVDKW